jgi:uncharacterized protein YecE (DUF72 family)
MDLHVGTSGFSYEAWRGRFYPEDVAAKQMLTFYAQQLSAVEINNTFYRMPKAALLESWAGQVPDGFSFTLKAARRITHIKRLRDTADDVAYLYRVASGLGDKRGAILFQLPPTVKKDVGLLREFLAALPRDHRAAIEFRNASWHVDEVYGVLHDARCALCSADTEDEPEPPVVSTAELGYIRLRRPGYDDAALAGWAQRIRAQPWTDAHVFFKHEDAALGPRLAMRFREIFDQSAARGLPPWRAEREREAAEGATMKGTR